jgi:hypothetical protein
MTKRHSEDVINAAMFAADQAREALCFLLQSQLTQQSDRVTIARCFGALGAMQKRADSNYQPEIAFDHPISRSSGEAPLAMASLNQAG